MRTWARVVIGVLAAFVALTAIGGGMAMLVGADQFPLAWLRGTPFRDYTVPALVLAVVVGGSSLVAAVAVFAGRQVGALAAMAAGVLLAGYIIVEVLTLKQVPPGPTPTEGLYLGLGLAMCGLAAALWLAERRRDHETLS
jgi:hypothetical protein